MRLKRRSTTAPSALHRSLLDARGVSTIEYVVPLCLVTIVAFGSWRLFGETVRTKIAGAQRVIADDLSPGGMPAPTRSHGGTSSALVGSESAGIAGLYAKYR